jgi:Zn-dependent protease
MSGNSFIFVIFLVIMAFNRFSSPAFDPAQWVEYTLLLLPAIIIGITFHEFMHAYSAYKLGDQTPKVQGRVTLNPLKHIDPIGIIILIFVGFGWGKPVQVNPYAFKGNRRLANLIVDVAGVLTNLVLAFLFSGLVILILYTATYSAPMQVILDILSITVRINLVLMLFNLLPVPPLDGFGIITEVFDLRRFSWYQQFYNSGMFILLALIVVPSLFGFSIIGWLLTPAFSTIPDAFYTFWQSIALS